MRAPFVRVAVKRLRDLHLAGQELVDFQRDAAASVRREINLLGSFRHPNIIRLLAYSKPLAQPAGEEVLQLALVYELADSGGLHQNLVDDERARALTWTV